MAEFGARGCAMLTTPTLQKGIFKKGCQFLCRSKDLFGWRSGGGPPRSHYVVIDVNRNRCSHVPRITAPTSLQQVCSQHKRRGREGIQTRQEDNARTCISEVLHRVLYPNAHKNEIKKTVCLRNWDDDLDSEDKAWDSSVA